MNEKRFSTGLGLAVAFAISLLCGFIAYRALGFTYAIADDVIMRDIVSGAFTGTPDGRLIFVQYALGFCISRLFMLSRGVDWYGLVIVGALFLGLAAVLYRGLTAEKRLIWKAAYVGITLGLFGLSVVMYAAWFQWTISAAVLGASALYLYATISGEKVRLSDGILIWLMLLLTFSIRRMVFFMVLPGFGIVFLCRFLKREENKIAFCWKEVVLPAVVFLAVGGVMLMEKKVYSGEGWEKFREFQDARAQVYDYTGVPSYIENPTFFEELGLGDNEITNLINYAFYLVEDIDAEKLEQVAIEARRQSGAPESFKGKLKNGIFLVVDSLKDKEFFPQSIPMLLFLVGGAAFALCYKKESLIPLAAFLGVEGLMWLYLGYEGRLPERVAVSMYFVMLFGVAAFFYRLYLLAEEEEQFVSQRGWKTGKAAVQSKNRKYVVVVLGVLLCLAGAVYQWRALDAKATGLPSNYQRFKDYTKGETERIFFIGTFMAEPTGGAVVTAHGDFRQTRCLTLGDWYSFSPLDDDRMASLGISNVEETLLTDPNAYLVLRDVEEHGFFEAYFEDKYPGCQVVYRDEVDIEGRGYRFYQVQWGQEE